MKKLNLIFVMFCIAAAVNAQNYKGTVKDTKGKAIPFASVILYSLPDSTFITGSITDDFGKFLFKSDKEITKGYLKVSSIGYETAIINTKQNIETIILKENIRQLGEVTISASRIERNASGYNINLKNEKSTKGKKVSELLAFLPGITKTNKSLKVFGRDVSVVYLNGIKIKNIDELESIPAELLSSAQIDYMAGSEESAATKGAVIRINLDKKKENGYFGSFGGDFTTMTKYGFTGYNIFSVINAKYNKLNIYNSISYGNNQAMGDFEEYKLFKASRKEIFSTEQYKNKEHYFYDRLSLTYDLNKKNELGMSLFASINDGDPTNKVDSKEKLNNIFTSYKSETNTPYRYNLFQATTNYKHKINAQGSEFKLTADYLYYKTKDNTHIDFFNSTPNKELKSNSSDISNMIELDAQLKWVFKSNNKLQTGVNFRSISTDYDRLDMSNMQEISKLSGIMPSLYSKLSGKINMLNYEIGLRLQENTIKYNTKGVPTINKNSDLDIYPSLNLMYMLNPNKGNMIMLSYKRSIDDIPYSAISPYKKYSSEYAYSIGNPNLISPKNNILMTAINLFRKFTISGIYMYTVNPIYFHTTVDNSNDEVSYVIPKNGDYESLLGIHVEGRFNPSKWWKLKMSATYTLYSIKNPSYEMKNQSKYNFSINNDFTLSKTAGATLKVFYEPTYHMRDRIFHNVYDIQGSIYKRFINDKLETKLTCKLFRKGRFLETNTQNIFMSSDNRTDERFIKFSIAYFFNGGKEVNVKYTNSTQDYNKIEDIK